MKRCAIYTRKSSDEGLDQQFNSLDAQREACEAYVLSQAGEGWSTLREPYDDGGYSGGSMERPALQRLLSDIAKGRVDVVVVYKIDRLTRSLADFARIVEQFDAREVSFVSVTQAFNTTSSMGRLTLNVLLSFAQFEREVTGERIRDKIAASKAKGMWMGGLPPLGYDAPAGTDRILRVNEPEAKTVRWIFSRYLELRSVHSLVADLAGRGVVSKVRLSRDGQPCGGQPFSRGALFHLLRNRVYRGEIVHKGEVYPGLHQPIVPAELFNEVQTVLDGAVRARRHRTADTSPLAGKLFLGNGTRLTPTHSRGAGGQIYRYYVPTAQQIGRGCDAPSFRLPAAKLEARLRSLLAGVSPSSDCALSVADRIGVYPDRLVITLSSAHRVAVRRIMGAEQALKVVDDTTICWTVPFLLPSKEMANERLPPSINRDPTLIKALRAAHAMLDHDRRGEPFMRKVPGPRYERRLARLAFLSPVLQAAIIAGTQPPTLTLEKIVRGQLPLAWEDQDRWAARLA